MVSRVFQHQACWAPATFATTTPAGILCLADPSYGSVDNRWTLIARESPLPTTCSDGIQENADAAGQIREAGKQVRTTNDAL